MYCILHIKNCFTECFVVMTFNVLTTLALQYRIDVKKKKISNLGLSVVVRIWTGKWLMTSKLERANVTKHY